MKRLLPILSAMIICLLLTSCGSASIKGDPTSYSNEAKSFSIELPASSDKSWVIDENAADSVLDISDKSDTVNIQVQCLSKSQAQNVASDLESYMEYALVNTLDDTLAQTTLNESDIAVPEFITDSISYEFSMSGGIKGVVTFMESPKCYYTYCIMAVDEAYSNNKKALLESITSLEELSEAPAGNAEEEVSDAQ